VLFGDLDAARARRAHGQLLPQAASTSGAPSAAPRRSHRVTYILCTEDRAVPLAAQEAMAASADATFRIQGDHCPQLSRPEELAQVLAEVVVGRRVSVPDRSA
jgi:pimeloyl-ACP methyl ester carboxylesterase